MDFLFANEAVTAEEYAIISSETFALTNRQLTLFETEYFLILGACNREKWESNVRQSVRLTASSKTR